MLAFDLDTAEMTGIIAFLRNPNYEVDAIARVTPRAVRRSSRGRATA